MLILIAESKTMAPCTKNVSADEYASHRPVLEDLADNIMSPVKGLTTAELVAETKLSTAMAERLRQMAAHFIDKSAGSKAIEAYTGVVFKAFSYPTLSKIEQSTAAGRVRIISSLYGWLRPDDIIKQYRFDFTMSVTPEGETLATYLRDKVTACLLQYLNDNDCHEILNLLPADAAKCIDWRRITNVAKVWKVEFREILTGEKVRTPHAGKLKTLRGQLLRQIIQEDINTSEQLLTLSSDNYIGAGRDEAGNIIFHTA